MNSFYKILILISVIVFYIIFSSCQSASKSKTPTSLSKIEIDSIAPNVWRHISYLNTTNWGKVACNGLIFKDGEEVIIVDTPVDDSASIELLQFIENELHAKVIAAVPTHFHDDCLGGLNTFHDKGILSFANIPSQKVLFGGCLVKELEASKGNLADADTLAWSNTIQNLKVKFPEAQIIVPGHGKFGDRSLLDYTEKLFELKH